MPAMVLNRTRCICSGKCPFPRLNKPRQRDGKSLEQYKEHQRGVSCTSLTAIYDEYDFFTSTHTLYKILNKSKIKGIPICPFVAQPPLSLLQKA
jgi:hypothetical protein